MRVRRACMLSKGSENGEEWGHMGQDVVNLWIIFSTRA